MKIRQGFVSNSSSSSFVLAVGKVLDRIAFEKYMKGVDVSFYTSEQLNGFTYYGGDLYREGFTGALVRVKVEPESLYFSVYESRDLMEDENGTIWDGEYTEGQLKIFDLEKQTFVSNVDITSDYGRNG